MKTISLHAAAFLFAFTIAPSAGAQQAAPPSAERVPPPNWDVLMRGRTHTPAPTTGAITAADLKTRLYIFADDSMQGRLLATAGNVKGVEYIASEVKRMGLLPMGDNVISWCCVTPGNLRRAEVVRELDGPSLVIVRYKATHYFHTEWVYNEADIDRAKVVWAREMGGEEDRRLLEYFRDRKVWLLEPDDVTVPTPVPLGAPPHMICGLVTTPEEGQRSLRFLWERQGRGRLGQQGQGGDAGDDGIGCYVPCDHGAGSHESPRPDSHPAEDDDSGAERGAPFHHRSQEGPISVALGSAFVGGGAREPVVDEENPVTDENLILDLHAVANERVARDLARRAYRRSPLDLDEGSDAGVTPDAAAVEVAERPDGHVLPELDVVDQPERSGVCRAIGHVHNLCAGWFDERCYYR